MTPDLPQESTAEHAPAAPGRPRRTTRLLLVAAAAIVVAAGAYNVALSRSLGTREVYVYGQSRWAPGLPASLRVVILKRGDERPIADAPVRIVLVRQKAEYVDLANGRTNEAGTLDASFTVPDGEGKARLLVVTEGRKQVDRQIHLVPAYRVTLATDRPAYRTGQNIRLQVWVFRAGAGQPAGDLTVSLRAFAPDGTLIAARPLRTDRQGRAATRVSLAPGAPAGAYRLKVAVGPSTAQAALPVVATPEPPFPAWLSDVTRFTVPGGLLRGRVTATDNLGSLLRGATARIRLERPDGHAVSWTSGQLDDRGEMAFGLPAPRSKEPLTLRLLAEVTDRRLDTARAMQAVAITPEPIQLAAIAEAGKLVPDVENRIFLVARYPDGSPAPATLRYALEGRTGTLDAGPLGVAVLSCTPSSRGASIAVTASDGDGRVGAYQADLAAAARPEREWALRDRYRMLTRRLGREPPPPILLRPDRGIYPAGGRLRLEALSPDADGPLYVDGFADGQTAFTRSILLRNGWGVLDVRLPEGLAGTLWLRAYRLGAWGDAVRSTRAVFVRPNHPARLSLQLGRAAYQPGQAGHLALHMGQPAAAAVTLSRVPAGGEVADPLLVGPPSTAAPARPGAPVDAMGQAPAGSAEQKQGAALAALALLPPPEGWSLQEDVFAQRQAQVQQRRAESWSWLRWAVLALLGGLWLLALVTRAFSRAPENGSGEPAGRETAPSSPLRFIAAAMVVALVATVLFRLSRDPVPQGVSVAAQLTADLQQERESQAKMAARRAPLLPPPLPRSVPVPDVAFWKTDLSPGGDGRATVLFSAPAEPGEWRLTATGVTAEGAVARTAVRLPVVAEVLAQVETPPLARVGDVVGVTVRVRNALPAPQAVRVKLMVGPGLFAVGEQARTDEIPGGAGVTRTFRAGVLSRPGWAAVTVVVSGRRTAASYRRQLEIRPAERETTLTVAGRLTRVATHELRITGAVRQASLALQASPAALAAARLPELQRAPIAGAMNQAAVLDIARLALPAGEGTHAQAMAVLDRGLQELLACRDKAGGFAAFPGQHPDVPSTVYAAAVLESLKGILPGAGPLARQARVWARSRQHPDGTWPGGEAGGRLAAAFAAWCLGPGDPAATPARDRYRARTLRTEDPYLLALGALGFGAPGTPAPRNGHGDAASFTDRLAALAIAGPGGRRWVARSATLQGLEGSNSAVETTALAAIALAGDARHRRLAEDALSFLAGARQSGGSWGGPFSTALALRAFASAASGGGKPGTVQVHVNGRPAGRLDAETPTLDLRSALAPGANTVVLRAEGGGPVFYELHVTGTGQTRQTHSAAPGLSARYTPTATGSRDAVVFAARLMPRGTGLYCLEVPIPAGFRPVRDDLEELVARGAAAAMHLGSQRVALFVDADSPGHSHRLSFRLSAPAWGEALAPAPEAYPVADPSARALGRAMRLVAEPAS